MAKIKKRTPQEEVEFLAAGISTEIDHWLALKETGSRDPFNSDGANMDLTRNHILHYRSEIERLCAENGIELPEEYHYAVPPEVDMDYMAPDLEFPERLENQYTKFGKTAVRTCPDYDPYQTKQEETTEIPETQLTQQVMSADYTKAVSLHRRICANAQAAQESLYEMCKALKEMRDGKLYKELGYQNFEDYTQSELGMGRSQAYKLIDISSNLSEDFVHTSGQIGVSKLHLLAMLNDSDRTEIVQNTDLEKTSVRELKEKISDLEKQKGRLIDEVKRAGEKEEGYKQRQEKLLTRNKQLVQELDGEKEKVSKAEKQIQELESRPRDSYEDTTKIDELTAKLRAEEERHRAELEKLRSAVPAAAVDLLPIFKSYMSAAADSMKRLTGFVEQNLDSPECAFFCEKLENIVTLTNQTIDKLKGA